jgi:hypothetical protein
MAPAPRRPGAPAPRRPGAPADDGGPVRRRRRWWLAGAVVAVFAAAGGTALVLPLLGPGTAAPGAVRTASFPAVRITPRLLPPDDADRYMIACVPAHPPDNTDCRRVIVDLRDGRPLLTEAELREAQPLMSSLALVVGGHGPADPRQVSDQLAAAGHPDAVVRTALPTDPVPAGSVVFALPVGQECLLGYVRQNGAAEMWPLGRLSDGTCMYR